MLTEVVLAHAIRCNFQHYGILRINWGDDVMMRLRLLRAALAFMSLLVVLAGCLSKPETVKARAGFLQ